MGSVTILDSNQQPALFFDGECNLCNGAVDFVLSNERARTCKFASLQSEVGQKLLSELGRPVTDFDSFLLVMNNQVYEKSTAALEVARLLHFPWSILRVFLLLPRMLRDPVYSLIAKNRYRWFGKSDTCRIPTPQEKARFL